MNCDECNWKSAPFLILLFVQVTLRWFARETMHSFLQSGASLVHAQILGMCANMETLTINLGMSYSRLLIRVKFT